MEIVNITFEEAIDICRKKIRAPPFTKEEKEAWARVSAAALTLRDIMKNIDSMLNKS